MTEITGWIESYHGDTVVMDYSDSGITASTSVAVVKFSVLPDDRSLLDDLYALFEAKATPFEYEGEVVPNCYVVYDAGGEYIAQLEERLVVIETGEETGGLSVFSLDEMSQPVAHYYTSITFVDTPIPGQQVPLVPACPYGLTHYGDAPLQRLTAGDNITIVDDVISASTGGSVPEAYQGRLHLKDVLAVKVTPTDCAVYAKNTFSMKVIIGSDTDSGSRVAIPAGTYFLCDDGHGNEYVGLTEPIYVAADAGSTGYLTIRMMADFDEEGDPYIYFQLARLMWSSQGQLTVTTVSTDVEVRETDYSSWSNAYVVNTTDDADNPISIFVNLYGPMSADE